MKKKGHAEVNIDAVLGCSCLQHAMVIYPACRWSFCRMLWQCFVHRLAHVLSDINFKRHQTRITRINTLELIAQLFLSSDATSYWRQTVSCFIVSLTVHVIDRTHQSSDINFRESHFFQNKLTKRAQDGQKRRWTVGQPLLGLMGASLFYNKICKALN